MSNSATLADRTSAELVTGLAFEALRSTDQRLNALAVELFGRFGQPLIRGLLLVAFNKKKRPRRRVRALEAIERIGRIDDPTCFLDLMN